MDLVIPRNADGSLGRPTTLVADAHAAGLKVHPWTFRAENSFLRTGIDGLFTDHTDVADVARDLGQTLGVASADDR